MNRREFLLSSAALACLKSPAAFAEEPRHQEPPYLKLKKFIEPGQDEFAGEKAALDLKARLRAAMVSKTLAHAAVGPTSYKPSAACGAPTSFLYQGTRCALN